MNESLITLEFLIFYIIITKNITAKCLKSCHTLRKQGTTFLNAMLIHPLPKFCGVSPNGKDFSRISLSVLTPAINMSSPLSVKEKLALDQVKERSSLKCRKGQARGNIIQQNQRSIIDRPHLA
jgi:hypothetical protein